MIIALYRRQDMWKAVPDDKGGYFQYRPSIHLDAPKPRMFVGRLLSGGVSYELLTNDGINNLVKRAHEDYGDLIESHKDKVLALEEGMLRDDEVTHRGLIVVVTYKPNTKESAIVVPGRYGQYAIEFHKKPVEETDKNRHYVIPVKRMDTRRDTFVKKLEGNYTGTLEIWPERPRKMEELVREVAEKEQRLQQAVNQ